MKDFTNSKMNDMKLKKAKGGHSWPQVMCEEIAECAMRPFLSIVEAFVKAWK
jgi:hypothetical protein